MSDEASTNAEWPLTYVTDELDGKDTLVAVTKADGTLLRRLDADLVPRIGEDRIVGANAVVIGRFEDVPNVPVGTIVVRLGAPQDTTGEVFAQLSVWMGTETHAPA